MKTEVKVYMPTKKEEEYLPYFEVVVDKGIDFIHYLEREIKLEPESELYGKAIECLEEEYNEGNSFIREGMEALGLKFEYVEKENGEGSYELVLDDNAKEYISEAKLNIAVVDGVMEELVLNISGFVCYGNAETIDCLTGEAKQLLNELVEKGLLEKQVIEKEIESIPVEDIIEIE